MSIAFNEVLGVNSVQDINNLTISKSDLEVAGLSSSANNRAEQLLVALLILFRNYFQSEVTSELQEIITDELGNSIAFDNSLQYDVGIAYWRARLTFPYQIKQLLFYRFELVE